MGPAVPNLNPSTYRKRRFRTRLARAVRTLTNLLRALLAALRPRIPEHQSLRDHPTHSAYTRPANKALHALAVTSTLFIYRVLASRRAALRGLCGPRPLACAPNPPRWASLHRLAAYPPPLRNPCYGAPCIPMRTHHTACPLPSHALYRRVTPPVSRGHWSEVRKWTICVVAFLVRSL